MDRMLTIQEILKPLKKRLVLIITVFLLLIGITGAVSLYILTPLYEASTQVLINNKKVVNQEQFSTQDIQTNLQLINTYYVIVKSPVILSEVIDNLNLNTTPELLQEKISISSEQDSQVISITVKDQSPKLAVDIANMTSEVFKEEIKELMSVDNVNILSPAKYNSNQQPYFPKPLLFMAIAAILGLLLGVSTAYLIELFDTTVKTEQDIEELLNIPIMGLISPITMSKRIKFRKK